MSARKDRLDSWISDWWGWIALIATVLVILAVFTIGQDSADSAPRQSPSPVKAFQDLPEGYSNIVAGCIGRNGWYSNQESRGNPSGIAQLVIIASDPNCVRGGVLNP